MVSTAMAVVLGIAIGAFFMLIVLTIIIEMSIYKDKKNQINNILNDKNLDKNPYYIVGFNEGYSKGIEEREEK